MRPFLGFALLVALAAIAAAAVPARPASDGGVLFYKYYEGTNAFLLTSRRQENWTITSTDIRALKPGEWHHAVVTWDSAEACEYLDGKQTACQARPQVPDGLSGRFIVGDHDTVGGDTPRTPHGDVGTLMDELYIHGRTLPPHGVAWAYEHAAERVPGQDVPEALTPPVRK